MTEQFTSEFAHNPRTNIVVPKPEDVESYRRMQARSWMDTYPNEAAGVSEEWVRERTEHWLTPEELEVSRQRVADILKYPDRMLYIAKQGDESVGMIYGTKIDGNQRIEALYVDKAVRGTGIAQELMDSVIEQFDPHKPVQLEVVDYNQRARRFYEKYGFVAQPKSEHLYADTLPSIVMIKPGEQK